MIAVIVILFVLIALAMIWLGIDIRMEESGLIVWVKVIFYSVQVYPKPKKTISKSEHKTGKTAKSDKKLKKAATKKNYNGLIKTALRAAGRLRRRLVVTKLIFHYTAGGDDPADTALQYGRVSAAVYGMMPEVSRIFNVKHRDISVAVDFDIPKPQIELEISMGLFVWQLFYIGAATLIDFLKLQN